MSTPVSMSVVLEILEGATEAASGVSGASTATVSTSSKDQAALSRLLLNLADQLALASSLVRNEYWGVKGETSYAV